MIIFGGIAIKYLSLHVESCNELFNIFLKLPSESKYALSFLLIAMVYFGGALYITSMSRSEDEAAKVEVTSNQAQNSETGGKKQAPASQVLSFLATPASCDTAVDFELPENPAVKDSDFFESMLDKMTDEIISDMPTVYEMNAEAVQW